jgi:hypothetical protein
LRNELESWRAFYRKPGRSAWSDAGRVGAGDRLGAGEGETRTGVVDRGVGALEPFGTAQGERWRMDDGVTGGDTYILVRIIDFRLSLC